MKPALAELCTCFIKNRDVIKNAFFWENGYLYPVCAAIFADKRKVVTEGKLMYCKNLLHEETGMFSNFRSTVKLALISMLAVDGDPEGKLRKSLVVHNLLKQKFFGSSYLPVASMIIADLVDPGRFAEITEKTRRIYDLMKAEHPFLTSSEDSVFAVMLALSNLTEEKIVSETETCYRILKQEFYSSNAVQSLSHVLALSEGAAGDKCKRTLSLFHALKQRGYKYSTDYELATLGILAMLPVAQDEIINDVILVDRFLSGQKGYGVFGLGRKQRLMHAAMIVTCYYMGREENLAMNTAAIGATVSLIAAQQAAMCAAIAASSSSAAANS